jgi:glycosyltransferase involved in cell wall biosynthesis
MGIPDDRFCLAYAGAILSSRDLESLLRHARRHPEDLVLIAGAGDRESWLRQQAEDLDNVRFLGWLADPSVLLSAADALYYALRSDHPYAALAAPNNLYIAIAHAVPLVYRAQGELAEVSREHEIGAPFTDDASLDAAVDSLRDPSVNASIRAGLAALRMDYTWERAVEPLLAVYPQAASIEPQRSHHRM